MKNNCIVFFAVFCLLSCSNKQDMNKIKKAVFANLVLGDKTSDLNKTFDSLKRRGELFFTAASNYPYLKIENFDGMDFNKNLFFPFFISNTDSVVTKIGYFVYSFSQQSPQVLSEMKDRNLIPKENVDMALLSNVDVVVKESKITNNFSLLNSYDKTYGFQLPKYAANGILTYADTRARISDWLIKKYNYPSTSDTIGNKYDDKDLAFKVESVWKLENVNIKLISMRHPQSIIDGTYFGDIFHILLYEFNAETMKKYNLNKNSDVKNTF